MEPDDWHRWWKTGGESDLRSLLMDCWDPIGVTETPEAKDEYDGYAGQLGTMLRNGADARAVAEYLSEVQTDRMGLPASSDELGDVGDRVTTWYAAAMRR
jgi:hypothetical protein